MTLPQSTVTAIGVSVGVLLVLVILFVIALFLVWHCARKNKQAEIAKQPSQSATQDGQEDIQQGLNMAYMTRVQDGRGQSEISDNGAYRNSQQNEQGELESSDDKPMDYEQWDETGQSEEEPYYSSIHDNGRDNN